MGLWSSTFSIVNPCQPFFFRRAASVDTRWFPFRFSRLISLTNQNLFHTIAVDIPIGRMCCFLRFPMVAGVTQGVIGVLSHFPLPKATGEIRQCCHDEIARPPVFLVHLENTPTIIGRPASRIPASHVYCKPIQPRFVRQIISSETVPWRVLVWKGKATCFHRFIYLYICIYTYKYTYTVFSTNFGHHH